MATKRAMDQDTASKTVEEFLKAQPDVANVNQIEQRLQLHVTNTQAYLPSYTRQVMDQNHGAPVVAVHTKTDPQSKKVFIYPAQNPGDRLAKPLRGGLGGPAFFAFGVPLRALHLKLPVDARIVLPLNPLQVPDYGTVYWASLADIEKETRDVDMEAINAAKKAKIAKAKAKKARKESAPADAPQAPQNPPTA